MRRSSIFLRWLISAIAVVVLAGCASRGDVVRHGFGFDFIADGREAELLDYRYGESRNPAARNSPEERSRGMARQQGGTIGDMLRGNELYVKWRRKATDEVFEDTVDLRSRLPKDIEDCVVTFSVRGSQLYVYLVTREPRPKNEPRNGPKEYSSKRVITLYPDQPKP